MGHKVQRGSMVINGENYHGLSSILYNMSAYHLSLLYER